MSIRALPLLVFAFLLYNALIVFNGALEATIGSGDVVDSALGTAANKLLVTPLFSIPMLSGVLWPFSWSDLILLVTLMLLFAEIVKATYTATASLVDHGLSMLLFIVCLIEFLVVRSAATSTFFLITVATLVDVVAGFTIGIRVARRDLSIGGMEH